MDTIRSFDEFLEKDKEIRLQYQLDGIGVTTMEKSGCRLLRHDSARLPFGQTCGVQSTHCSQRLHHSILHWHTSRYVYR